jgi:hypothetical protein
MAATEPRSEGPPIADGQGARVTLSSTLQLRSARGAGVTAAELSVAAGAVEESVDVVVVDVSVGAVLFSVVDGVVAVLALLAGIALLSVAAGVVCVVVVFEVVVDESVDCATAAPIPASRAAAAATADNFFW